MDADRRRARVRWFNQPKGYGYLRTDEGDDVFVHHRVIEGDGFRTLRAGQAVTVVVGDDGRGPAAVSVQVVDDEADTGAGRA